MTTILDKSSDLEEILEATLKGLDGRGIKHSEVEEIHAGSAMATATLIAIGEDSITPFIQDDAHVFYRWDYLFTEEGEEESKGFLQVHAIQNGLLYTWNLCTAEWAINQQEDRYDFEQDRLDPMHGASEELKALVDQIENRPDEFTEAYVEAAVKSFDENDLTGNYHQIRHIADNALGTRNIPYRSDAYTTLQEMQPNLKRAVEEHLEGKREKAIDALVESFPDWYYDQGSPRLSKNLIKLFAQDQGYRFTNQFVDELKVRIDVAIARAS